VLLLSSVGAGLMITGIEEDAEESRYKEDWRATFDLDADEADGGDVDAGTNAHARAAEQPRVRTVETARRVGARRSKPNTTGEAVQAEYARLGCGRGPNVALEAFRLHLDQVGRQATAPHPRRSARDVARVYAPKVLRGILTAAAQGCLRLCGREEAIRKQLAVYGIDLPARCLAPVLRLLCELGCLFVWMPDPAKGHLFSKRYVIEVGEVLRVDGPMHLAMLQVTQPVSSEATIRAATRQVPNASEPVAAREPVVPTSARGHVAGEAAIRTASGPPPGRPAAPGPTYREFLRLAVGVMLVLGREVLESHEVAAPSPVPTEGEVPPPTPTSKAGQADAAGGQGVGQRWSFAAAISSAERTLAAAGRWAEAVDGAWHVLAWPLPREATSPADMDPPLNGDMLSEPGRPFRTDETLRLQGPAAVRLVQPVAGVGFVAPRVATRSWLAAHVKHSDAGPRGPPRRRPRHE